MAAFVTCYGLVCNPLWPRTKRSVAAVDIGHRPYHRGTAASKRRKVTGRDSEDRLRCSLEARDRIADRAGLSPEAAVTGYFVSLGIIGNPEERGLPANADERLPMPRSGVRSSSVAHTT
jgi:hypothetical protein